MTETLILASALPLSFDDVVHQQRHPSQPIKGLCSEGPLEARRVAQSGRCHTNPCGRVR